MFGKILTLALIATPALAQTTQLPTQHDGDQMDQGTHNTQIINRPPGDPSVVRQMAGPGSSDNTQTAIIASAPGLPPNSATQSTGGSGNNQAIVMQGGSGNVVVQTQHGTGNHQSVVQTGNGNTAIQTQRGHGLSGALQQGGGQTDVQDQQGRK